jgi:hydroxyacylglutathione hydrolase
MPVSIYPIRLGFGRCFVVQGEGSIVVDSGSPNQAERFKQALERLSVRPRDIQLMVLTHGHWDHTGSAKAIKEFTGARIAMHWREKDCLEKSLKPVPPGVTAWGRIFGGTVRMLMPRIYIPATNVDLILGDDDFSLAEYGIPGKVIPTPGHSMGSVSVLLETGDALVGDLAMNEFPLRFSPGLPIMAEDLASVKQSWQVLLDAGAKTIYPGHGKPFAAEIMRKALL